MAGTEISVQVAVFILRQGMVGFAVPPGYLFHIGGRKLAEKGLSSAATSLLSAQALSARAASSGWLRAGKDVLLGICLYSLSVSKSST